MYKRQIQRDALQNKFDILLVFMFDRLGRREDETPFVVEWFVKHGIAVWSVNEGEQRFDTHLRIIDDFSFNLCEQILEERIPAASRDRTRSLRSTSPALLTGILFCGSCGGRMCFNHNSTVKYLADGTKRAYERDVYRCYRKVSHHGGCSGRSTYPLEKIEEAVLKIVHQYFENIRSVPTVQMLAAARQRSDSMDEIALANAEEALQKAVSYTHLRAHET